MKSLAAVALLAMVSSCGADGAAPSLSQSPSPLVSAVCVQSADLVPLGSWLCPQVRLRQCSANAHPETLYVIPSDAAPCRLVRLGVTVTDVGAGDSQVQVERLGVPGHPVECATRYFVLDTLPPEVQEHSVTLWPPNHELHTIRPSDCVDVHDACDAEPTVAFTWATSDEPSNSTGDGNTSEDIEVLGCDSVRLRAERNGQSNGRVYQLGWIAADAARQQGGGDVHRDRAT